MSISSGLDVLSVDTDDEENLLDLSQCSEFDDSESVSASVFDLLDSDSLLDDREDHIECHRTAADTKSNVTQVSKHVPRLPITAPKRPIPGPKLPIDTSKQPSTAPKMFTKPLKQSTFYQRMPITAPKQDVTSPRSPITAPKSVTMETDNSVSPPLDVSCASRDNKSTIIKLASSTSFHYVPEELPFVELPELAKKPSNRTSPRKRAFTVSSDDGPTLLLETKRTKTEDNSDLRNFISNSKTNKPRSMSTGAAISPLLTTPLLPTPQLSKNLNPPLTSRKVTIQSVKSRLQLKSNIHSTKSNKPSKTESPCVTSVVTQPLKLPTTQVTRRSIFASRPNITCYTSSGMGGFSLKHLGNQDATFSLNHL